MKYIMLLLSAMAGIMLSSALSVNDDIFDPLANATIVDLKWIVPISPDRNDTVVGTIEDVARYLSAVDPERFAATNTTIYKDIYAPLPDRPASSFSAQDDDGLYDAAGYSCGVYDSAKGNNIKDGIKHLRAVVGEPSLGPGPNTCGRVSCSYNSAIWWCNWSDHDITLDGFGRIADGAQDLTTSCAFIQDDGHIGQFSGNQAFGKSGVNQWWTVVRKNWC